VTTGFRDIFDPISVRIRESVADGIFVLCSGTGVKRVMSLQFEVRVGPLVAHFSIALLLSDVGNENGIFYGVFLP
jgi:hypothetical protein